MTKHNAIYPIILLELCNTISVSVCPNPPTFGSFVNGWSICTKDFSETITLKPDGITCLTSFPSVPSIIIVDSPFSETVICLILPLTGAE